VRTIEAVRRSGVGIAPERTIRDAARTMEEAGVGSLVVTNGARPLGIVTDRDLVRRGLSRGLPTNTPVEEVMSAPVVTIDADADLHAAFALFRTHGVRRLVVLRDGHFVGMISVDDLLIDVAADLSDLARPVTAEILFAHREMPASAAT